jgi:GNAT superfamily N-acetyltransferase
VPYTHADAQELVEAVQQEYVERYGGPDETPLDAADFDPPTGVFLIGRLAGLDARPVACGGIRRVDDDTAEIKRMYVAPHARRRGLARAVLTRLEEAARDAGYTRLVLESGNAQPEALALYRSSGYTPVTPYGFYRCHADANSLGKALPGRPASN